MCWERKFVKRKLKGSYKNWAEFKSASLEIDVHMRDAQIKDRYGSFFISNMDCQDKQIQQKREKKKNCFLSEVKQKQ